MIHIERLGVYLSRPVAFIAVLIYLVHFVLLVYLTDQKFDLEKQVNFQQKRITELEQKLQLYKVIEDLQIGFTKDETGQLTNVIYDESKKYHYDPLFLVSVIVTESSFKKHQVSDSGAIGLMQLIPLAGASVAERAGVSWSGPKTLKEPEANIKIGSAYLFEQILKFKDVKKALVAYNVGETKLRGLMRDNKPLPHQYLNKVTEVYKRLKETYQLDT
jgi:soluble lytic murein transglycosylase-like protein